MVKESSCRSILEEKRRQEDALITLIDCKSKEVDRFRAKINRYQSKVRSAVEPLYNPIECSSFLFSFCLILCAQLAEALRNLNELNAMLSRLGSNAAASIVSNTAASTDLPVPPLKLKIEKETEDQTPCTNHVSHTTPTQDHSKSKKIELLIPAVKAKPIPPMAAIANPEQSAPSPQSMDSQSNGLKRGRFSIDGNGTIPTPLCSQSVATSDAKKKKVLPSTGN